MVESGAGPRRLGEDFVDDQIDRCRDDDDDDDLAGDIDELKQAVAELNTKLDRLATERAGK